MSPDTAKLYATELAVALAATASLQGQSRLAAVTAAWNEFGGPVVSAFHEPHGVSLYSIYGDMLRAYGRACSQALDESQETDPCTTTC